MIRKITYIPTAMLPRLCKPSWTWLCSAMSTWALKIPNLLDPPWKAVNHAYWLKRFTVRSTCSVTHDFTTQSFWVTCPIKHGFFFQLHQELFRRELSPKIIWCIFMKSKAVLKAYKGSSCKRNQCVLCEGTREIAESEVNAHKCCPARHNCVLRSSQGITSAAFATSNAHQMLSNILIPTQNHPTQL